MDAGAGYGLWPLVVVNTALFVVFTTSFFRPRTGRDWRAMSAFTAFLLALFTEGKDDHEPLHQPRPGGRRMGAAHVVRLSNTDAAPRMPCRLPAVPR